MSVLPAGFTSTGWFTHAVRAGAAWVGSVARHTAESPQRTHGGRDRREGPYMEMARMAREMERL